MSSLLPPSKRELSLPKRPYIRSELQKYVTGANDDQMAWNGLQIQHYRGCEICNVSDRFNSGMASPDDTLPSVEVWFNRSDIVQRVYIGHI